MGFFKQLDIEIQNIRNTITWRRKQEQLEMFPITEDQKACNANVKACNAAFDSIWAIMESWKHPVDHTKQLSLFPVGNYEAWQMMVDREGK